MTEYTSFEVSKRLEEAGFADKDAAHELGNLDSKGDETWASSYGTDTLLVWLLERGIIERIVGNREHVSVTYSLDTSPGVMINCLAHLPDAFAEVIIEVLTA